ncbi:hypothetical protein [Thermofilum sp.]|jgi:hypothetical protein|uniref:hypothetical protein n=1 Tax=Thermofilum sp. TaxID=1961369 RepID=UPI002589459E|nr:hypothetical protein [Thermofilum sp.]
MPLQTPVGYTISYDKETGKLVLEIFDLEMIKEETVMGHLAELHFEGETAPKHLKIMFPDYKSLVAYLLYSVLYK